MRTLVLVSSMMLTLSFVNAQQISDHTIGLRIGASNGFGTEISYQHALDLDNRLEANLGWKNGSGFTGFRLAGLYQWIWQLDGTFNWYAGAGGGVANYTIENSYNETSAFAAGNLGIEYDFDFPLLLSLDFRPEVGFGSFDNNLEFDVALGVRYQF